MGERAKAPGLGWWERVLIRLGTAVIAVLTRTLRYRIQGEDVLQRLLSEGRPPIVGVWHGRILMGVRPFTHYRPVIMISQSRDGERIARVVERFGWETVRGSSSRGGSRALAGLVRALRSGRIAAHVVDGPRGPATEIKPGLFLAAQRSGAPIVLMWLVAQWRWETRSWDRMQIPLPFSKVWIQIGEPVEVGRDLDPQAFEALRLRLERDFRRGYEQLERKLRPEADAGTTTSPP